MNSYSAAGALDRQSDLLACLQNVVRQLNRSDIRTVSALIAKTLGDQNAALMAVRLLHWFPRAKKAGGWVYKSWRDWNAECNLSQAQVKRVHGKGFLEIVGIERKTMKANGTPTVHYRLDENRLVQRLSGFLEVMPDQIQLWMCPEVPYEFSKPCSSHEAALDQLIEPTQTNTLGEDELMNPATTAQSITDSDSQTKQHKDLQDIQHNSYSAVIANAESEEKAMLSSLKKLGINDLKAKQLIEKHGQKCIAEVIMHTKDRAFTNPAGYVIRALENNWTSWSKSIEDDTCEKGRSYIMGEYAAFIEH